MVANRLKNVRAAVFYAPGVNLADKEGKKVDPFEIVRLSREHNNANILSIGARFTKEEDAIKAIDLWLKTEFSEISKHQRRINKF
jgi:ribose 5-phosphate isomerase B